MFATLVAILLPLSGNTESCSGNSSEVPKLTELLSSLQERFENIQTYRCKMRLESFEREHKIQNQALWYKKPGYVRIEQLGPFKKGAVVVIHPNGNIRGHLGGALSIFKADLEPEDSILLGVTNDSAVTADYGSIIQSAIDHSNRVKKHAVRGAEESGKPVIILDSFFDEAINQYRIVTDAEKRLITRIERYRQDKLIHVISWTDVEIDVQISDSFFEL
jgi:outer membrane lipoprotein-sorting protein